MNIFRFLFLASLLVSGGLQAEMPGMMDTTFRSGGGMTGGINAVVRQRDGKILIGGNLSTVQGFSRSRISRLLANGKTDPAFNPGSGASSSVHTMAVQADGKILVGGDFTAFNGTPRARIVRLMPDGSVDATFNPGSGATGSVYAVAVQPDGKILIGGFFTTYNATPVNRIARLNPDGSLDATFNMGTGVTGGILAQFVLQPDGKILIGGPLTNYNGTARNGIMRLNADGSLDTAFNPGSGVLAEISGLGVQKDGKVVIGGSFTSYNGTPVGKIARINVDGSLDTTFNTGTGVDNTIFDILVQPDAKVLIAGDMSSYNGSSQSCLMRLAKDGKPDPSFKVENIGADDTVYAVAALPDGRTFIGGQFERYGPAGRRFIALLKADGSVDPAFDSSAGANGTVLALAAQPDGKVIIGGSFTAYGGTARARLARIHANGTLDLSFNPGSGADASIQSIALQPDGKVVIGGLFTTYNGISRGRIARLNGDGTLDTTFNPGTGANDAVRCVRMQADGKIVLSGLFMSVDGAPRPRLARLNSNGSVDNAVSLGTGPDNIVTSVSIQPDGKIVVTGRFTTYHGVGRSRIARLNADGSLDSAFNPGTGLDGEGFASILQPDGKIIVSGAFDNCNGVASPGLVRLNSDGSVDTSFFAGTGPNLDITALAVQADNKFIIGGSFSEFDRRNAGRVARLHLGFAHAALTFAGITFSNDPANAPLVGNVSIRLAKTGAFTGSLGLGTERLAFTGVFDREGRCLTTATRKNRSVIYVNLAMGRTASGDMAVQGKIEDFSLRSAELLAYAPYFSTKTIPANHFTGKYTVALTSAAPGAHVGALPPSGAGFIICTVSATGMITMAGKAADGSRLTAAGNLTEAGSALLSFPLYKGLGFITGSLLINDATLDPVRRPVSGDFRWQRPPGVPYASGFNVQLTGKGSQYIPKLKTLPPFGGAAVNSVKISAAGGHLSTVTPLAADAAFALTGKATVAAGGTLTGLKMTVNRTTGTFSGTFIPPAATKPVTVEGVIVNDTQALGYGLVANAGTVLPATITLDVLFP